MTIQAIGVAALLGCVVGTIVYALFTRGAAIARGDETPSLESMVHEALDNAKINGYYGPEEECHIDDIAEDLAMCCADFEGCNTLDLEPHVKTWLTANR